MTDEAMQRLRGKIDGLLESVAISADYNPAQKIQEARAEILKALAAEIERAEVAAQIEILQKLYKERFASSDDNTPLIMAARVADEIKRLQSKTGGDNAKGN